jgi:hypothetical protein
MVELVALQTGYRGLSLAIHVQGVIQMGLTPVSALSGAVGATDG